VTDPPEPEEATKAIDNVVGGNPTRLIDNQGPLELNSSF
jgi:hypothetical protein